MAKDERVVGILGRKIGMTQIFDESGQSVPVTVLQAGPCDVLQVRTSDRDGYEAVQLGYLDKPRRLASRAQRGQVAKLDSKRSKKRSAAGVELLAKANCEPKRYVREIRGPAGDLDVGSLVKVDAFEGVATVDVVGTSKGRGFSGAMKRHNFSGQRATHGVKKCHRHLGGTGCSASPSRLMKGVKMPGQYGAARCTVRNQKIVRIDAENNLLLVRGAVPGPNGGYVVVKKSNKM
ncbi:50S ribosomal protein L3 [Bythopirellula polymerisocia]|uniref:Large ribosomal subunit protein uL3 n=2 Tax=Bythopirellula polymerisocia TaxID=2528003 RepID=A0A5C6D1N4_9BACT|nr:50S ribosomal protein L3 [Bythopirellula polymerisocia]